MSRAGTKSSQGDDYQILVALHWLIRLLGDEDIDCIQAESNGLPGIDEKVSVDDVVVVHKDGRNRFIQVKKNQPRHRAWFLSDLKGELPKIRDQLETKEDAVVALYSRTPFGDFHSLAEACREYPDLLAFGREAGHERQADLTKLAEVWGRTEAESFGLLRRVQFGPHHNFEEWERLNGRELSRMVPHASTALPVLKEFLRVHQSKLQAANLTIRREDVLEQLGRAGLALAPMLGEEEVLEQFRRTTCIGRDWRRTVGGRRIRRPELDILIEKVESGVGTVLVTDRPGSGKTCLLLDLADHIEQDPRYGLLFIKGDRFAQVRGENDFKAAGLPEDIVGLCGRLSEYRRVAVIVDSLDVLSMNREHGALQAFLNLIDRLGSMKKVSVVSACRSFDLQYDPLLRDRKWGEKIELADFDFEEVVAPLLKEWGIAETRIDDDLKKLLRLPQNLRLFETIARRSDILAIRNVYELHEVYLDEAVRKSQGLGDPAMAVLRKLADRLLRDRVQMIPLAVFPGDESVRHALVSNGVLHQDTGGVGFGHQTLFDSMAVYSALAQGKSLSEFIQSNPPLPFIRPAVRTFVLFLRTHAPDNFSRQVWQALREKSIAYHLKLLIVESLAEISPDSKDWPLVRRLFQREPELFRRLLWKVQGDAWFRLLVDCWAPSLDPPEKESEWHNQFVSSLRRWMNSHPEEVIRLWRNAFSGDWIGSQQICRIGIDLGKFKHWRTKGIAQLIETLLQKNNAGRNSLGRVISRYVDATDTGDELLWRYITQNVEDKNIQFPNFKTMLNCKPSEFHDKQFLEDRMSKSPALLSMAVDSMEGWSASRYSNTDPVKKRSPFFFGLYHPCIHDWIKNNLPPLSILLQKLVNMANKFRSRLSSNSRGQTSPMSIYTQTQPNFSQSTLHSPKCQWHSTFLYGSSWERSHSRRDLNHVDSLTFLLNGVERAIIEHSKADDAWWQEHESKLRCSREITFRYFLVKSYAASSETNVDGIGEILADKELLRYGQIDYELCELIRAGFHLIEPKLQEDDPKNHS